MNAACRRWRESHPERVRWFDTDNTRYRIDIDTPEDLRRFTERTGHELRWPQGAWACDHDDASDVGSVSRRAPELGGCETEEEKRPARP